jgi:hypothetical protein
MTQIKAPSLFQATGQRYGDCDDVANRDSSLLLHPHVHHQEELLLPGNDEGGK